MYNTCNLVSPVFPPGFLGGFSPKFVFANDGGPSFGLPVKFVNPISNATCSYGPSDLVPVIHQASPTSTTVTCSFSIRPTGTGLVCPTITALPAGQHTITYIKVAPTVVPPAPLSFEVVSPAPSSSTRPDVAVVTETSVVHEYVTVSAPPSTTPKVAVVTDTSLVHQTEYVTAHLVSTFRIQVFLCRN